MTWRGTSARPWTQVRCVAFDDDGAFGYSATEVAPGRYSSPRHGHVFESSFLEINSIL